VNLILPVCFKWSSMCIYCSSLSLKRIVRNLVTYMKPLAVWIHFESCWHRFNSEAQKSILSSHSSPAHTWTVRKSGKSMKNHCRVYCKKTCCIPLNQKECVWVSSVEDDKIPILWRTIQYTSIEGKKCVCKCAFHTSASTEYALARNSKGKRQTMGGWSEREITNLSPPHYY